MDSARKPAGYRHRWAILVVAALAALALGACADDKEVVDDGLPSQSATPLTPAPGTSQGAPYEGPLGDFIVTPGEAGNDLVCDDDTVSQLESELSAAFPDESVFAEACSASVSFDGGITLTRLAYRGELRISFEAPRERLELLTVGGRAAIVAHPPIEQLPSQVAALEREPAGDEPGIFIELSLPPGPGSLQDGLDLLEQFLSGE